MDKEQYIPLLIIISLIGLCLFIGWFGSKRKIGFLKPFLGSFISMMVGLWFIALPLLFADSGGRFSFVIILILLISLLGGPFIALGFTYVSEKKEEIN